MSAYSRGFGNNKTEILTRHLKKKAYANGCTFWNEHSVRIFMTHINKHHCRKSQGRYSILWVWPISILSPLSLPTGFWTKWPRWQACALNQGCPEGQSHCSLLLNAQHAKKKSKALCLHGNWLHTRCKKSLALQNSGRKQYKKNLGCATAHEKAQVTARAQKAEDRNMKNRRQFWNQFKELHLPSWI